MKNILGITLSVILMVFFALQSVEAQELEWAKKAGGINFCSAEAIAIDDSGDSYVTGGFTGPATFGAGEAYETTLNGLGSGDIFVAKYHSSGNLLWAKQAGGSNYDQGSGIAVDDSGDSYVTGYIVSELATFGLGEANETTLISSGSYDIFVAKYHRSGNLLWAKKAGGIDYDGGGGIAVDGSGDSYLTGFFYGSATFGLWEANETTLISSGASDIFVAKYNSSGDLLWAKKAGGIDYDDGGGGIAVDGSGNSYVTGLFPGSATFGAGEANETTLISSGSYDIFVAKYHSNGNLLWAQKAGGFDYEENSTIAVDDSGDSFVTGSFERSATFGAGEANETTLNNSGGGDIFVAKYNSSGNLLWAKQAGGSNYDQGSGIAVDDSGDSYVTGYIVSELATFGLDEANETTLINSGNLDIFVAKYHRSGNLLWAKQAGGIDYDHGNGIAVDGLGNSYVTGAFEGLATFGAGETNETTLNGSDYRDMFVAKFGETVSDNTPPSCELTAINSGSPVSIEITAQDGASGLAVIDVLEAANATVDIPSFTVGTNDPIIVIATKNNQSRSSSVKLDVIDRAGNVTVCSPVITLVIRKNGKPARDTHTGIPNNNHYVTVINRDPGLKKLKIKVNGTEFKVKGLGDGEETTIDVLSAMHPGANNTITLVARGKPGGSADIIIHD